MTNAPGAARTLLGLTEGERFGLTLNSGDGLTGTVQTTDLTPPGKHFQTDGELYLEFTSAGVRFDLELRYAEDDQGLPSAESLDLRLTEGLDWEIPIESPVIRVRRVGD